MNVRKKKRWQRMLKIYKVYECPLKTMSKIFKLQKLMMYILQELFVPKQENEMLHSYITLTCIWSVINYSGKKRNKRKSSQQIANVSLKRLPYEIILTSQFLLASMML